jgi:putative Mg2+ transporter-C (MgtC) family protein
VYELWQITVKIALSAVLGGAVGAERELTGKWAGLRTHMLIAVGSALLTDLSIKIGPHFAAGSTAWDPGRIAAGIVTGVGFIGAGTILQARGTVRGLTTAAGLWVAAAIGMAVGAGFYGQAVLATLALLVILAALRPLEKKLLRGDHETVTLTFKGKHNLGELAKLINEAGVDLEELKVPPDPDETLVEVHVRGSEESRSRLRELAREAGLKVYEEEERGRGQ